MSSWSSLLEKPADFQEGPQAMTWFGRIAEHLLNRTHLVAAGMPLRFTEIEFYYYSEAHPDIFAHRDPIQQHLGRWYFHRTKGTYRGGSFKGLDIAFGSEESFAGVLIRGLEKPSGDLIDGPSLNVDNLLGATGYTSVADLDKAIGERPVWDETSPLHLEEIAEPETRDIYQTPRVGLAMWGKPGPTGDKRWRYIMRPYRFLTRPERIKKGKPHMVVAMHHQGIDRDRIFLLTGSPRKTIERYIADYQIGRQSPDPTPYFGADLNPALVCKIYGSWTAAHDPAADPGS